MKILITGANGLLGQKLVALISGEGNHELLATGRGSNRLPSGKSYTYASMDITDRERVLSVCREFRPDTIIHTAAMTNVDQCEEKRKACWEMNVSAVSNIIEACRNEGSHLVHVSTDFIFDGSKGPLTEDEIASPVNYYGESKLAAEKAIINSNISWSIARTVLVYGVAHDMSRSNIILWVRKSLEEGKEINVVDDQWRTPTLAEDLAIGCYLLATSGKQGIFNISGKDFMTPYEMAIATAEFFQLDKSLIHQTDGSKFKQKAMRPPRTGFVIEKARHELGYEPRSFREGLAILKSQLAS